MSATDKVITIALSVLVIGMGLMMGFHPIEPVKVIAGISAVTAGVALVSVQVYLCIKEILA